MEKKRVNLMMNGALIDRLDSIAAEIGVSRTALMNMILKQYCDSQDALKIGQHIGDEEKLKEMISKFTTASQF